MFFFHSTELYLSVLFLKEQDRSQEKSDGYFFCYYEYCI